MTPYAAKQTNATACPMYSLKSVAFVKYVRDDILRTRNSEVGTTLKCLQFLYLQTPSHPPVNSVYLTGVHAYILH